MKSDKRTDYKALQVKMWCVSGMVSLVLGVILVWLGLKIILDPSTPSLLGVVFIATSVICGFSTTKKLKQKLNQLKAS